MVDELVVMMEVLILDDFKVDQVEVGEIVEKFVDWLVEVKKYLLEYLWIFWFDNLGGK